MNQSEILKYAVESGILDLNNIQKQIEMNKREELLKKHTYKIWEGSDGSWKTYIPDATKNNCRRLVKVKDKKKLEDIIIDYITKIDNEEKLEKKESDRIRRKEIEKRIKEELLIEREKIEKEQERINKERDSLTLNSLFPIWKEYKSLHSRSSSYIKRITNDWNKYYVPQKEFINKPLYQFTKFELDTWAHEMIKTHSLSKKQYYNMSIILRDELRYAVDTGKIQENPFEFVKINTKLFRPVKKKESETEVYKTNEVPNIVRELIMKFKESPWDTTPLAILFIFCTGLRAGELVALKKEDISPSFDEIHIHRQIVKKFDVDEDGYNMKFTGYEEVEYAKTDDGDRYVYLTDAAQNILRAVLLINQTYGYSYNDFIFVDKHRRISYYRVAARLKRACLAIGIDPKSLHKIRKTYISSLIDAGVNIDEIRRLVGHADERTTYGNYCFNRLTKKETRDVIERALWQVDSISQAGIKNV